MVDLIEGPVLVIACAGSGKTRVLIERVVKLLGLGVQPERILLLTFTRRAAREMLDRAGDSHRDAGRVNGGTFHAFAMRVISQFFRELKLPRKPTVIDTDDAANAIALVAESLDLDLKTSRLPSKSALRELFSFVVNRNSSVETALSTLYPQFIEKVESVEKIRKAYARYKFENAYVDFDDLLILLNLLLKNSATQLRIQRQFDYVLIDEFQDTNALQGQITLGLSSLHKNVMVVGDDAQSIYAFRGAYHGNILGFPRLFKDCQLITLEDNYRSTQPILDLANAVLGLMETKFDKSMRAALTPAGEKPRLHFFENAMQEADYIADQIKEALEAERDLSKIAVLYRNNMVSFQLEAALTRRNIAYIKYGGLKITEMAHVKDVLASLRILFNPLDELAWLRALQLLEGIGAVTASKLFSAFKTNSSEGLQLLSDDLDPLQRALISQSSLPQEIKYRQALGDYLVVLLEASHKKSPLAMYEIVVEHYSGICYKKYDKPEQRLDDLEYFKTIIGRYRSLEICLSDLTLDPVSTKGETQPNNTNLDHEPVVLSTIHSAKGLEWEQVYLIGMQDGVIPSSRSLNKPNEEDLNESLEEEKRLLYVATTRAKRHLDLSFALMGNTRNSSVQLDLSRFLQDESVAVNYTTVTHNVEQGLSVDDVLDALSGSSDK